MWEHPSSAACLALDFIIYFYVAPPVCVALYKEPKEDRSLPPVKSLPSKIQPRDPPEGAEWCLLGKGCLTASFEGGRRGCIARLLVGRPTHSKHRGQPEEERA